jgi:DNA-binding transcriptional regulator YiaG
MAVEEIKMNGTYIKAPKGEWVMKVNTKAVRKQLNLTQAALAPLLGVSVRSVKYWEAGERNPSKAVLILLDQLLTKAAK